MKDIPKIWRMGKACKLTMWDRIMLILYPMITIETDMGIVCYKIDKKNKLYIYEINSKLEDAE